MTAKNFKPSNRPSTDVKIGDWILINDEGSELWGPAKDMVGKVYQVSKVDHSEYVTTSHNRLWRFASFEFTIMEEDTVPGKTPRKHPHTEMIRQWLDDDSVEVEAYCRIGGKEAAWHTCESPSWEPDIKYRLVAKAVPAWRVLYSLDNGSSGKQFAISNNHYKTRAEFEGLASPFKFIQFIAESEIRVR